MTVLHDKYRPRSFERVVGQDAAVTALQDVIKRRSSRAFLLFGTTAGIGKTTLARIGAKAMGCANTGSILEIDGATYTGIDAMRQIQEQVQYKTLGGEGRAVIVDECHRLSKQAWDSLLKVTEKPPSHLSWWFCTTEPDKIPKTIASRCTRIPLKPVSDDALGKLYDRVHKAEAMQVPTSIRGLIIKEAHGSPRQLLVNLDTCRDVKEREAAADLLRHVLESDAMIGLCRFVVQGTGSWNKAMVLVKELGSESAEGIRIRICNYVAVALQNSVKEREISHLLTVLECFEKPYNTSEGMAPLLLSIGRVLFAP